MSSISLSHPCETPRPALSGKGVCQAAASRAKRATVRFFVGDRLGADVTAAAGIQVVVATTAAAAAGSRPAQEGGL